MEIVSYIELEPLRVVVQNPRFNGKGFCFMGIGGKKAGHLPADLYNEAGPITKIEPPSEESFEKKTDLIADC